jgi:hypothetical protein
MVGDKFGRKHALSLSLFGSCAGVLWTLVVCESTYVEGVSSTPLINQMGILKAAIVQIYRRNLFCFRPYSTYVAIYHPQILRYILWQQTHVRRRKGIRSTVPISIATVGHGSDIEPGASISITSTPYT